MKNKVEGVQTCVYDLFEHKRLQMYYYEDNNFYDSKFFDKFKKSIYFLDSN